jgi:hypothetical protein
LLPCGWPSGDWLCEDRSGNCSAPAPAKAAHSAKPEKKTMIHAQMMENDEVRMEG